MKTKFTYHQIIVFLLLMTCLILLSLIIHALYVQSIFIWDEAIYANNALDMAKNHRYMVYTVNDVVDHYNTKPPLVIWMEALCFQLFSYHEFALRLPTLFALLGIILLFYNNVKKLGLPLLVAVCSGLILITTRGAIRPHVFLTGDLDAMLVLFISMIVFIHVEQLKENKVSSKQIVSLCMLFFLGYFTKSVAVFLILPALFVSYLYAGLLKHFFLNKWFYIGVSGLIVFIAMYYIIREQMDPGYFNVVVESEFKRFTNNVMSWHTQPYYYYISNIVYSQNPYYFILTLLLVWPYIKYSHSGNRRIVTHLFMLIIVYLITISIPSDKLVWYDAPIYPVWAFALAIMIAELYRNFSTRRSIQPIVMPIVLLILFCFPVYSTCQYEVGGNRTLLDQEKEASFIKQADQELHLASYTVLMEAENHIEHLLDALNFYKNTFQLNQHKTIRIKQYLNEVNINDTLVVVQTQKLDSLNQLYHTRKMDNKHPVFYIVESKK